MPTPTRTAAAVIASTVGAVSVLAAVCLGAGAAGALPVDPPPAASTAPSAAPGPSGGVSPSTGTDPSAAPGADGSSGDSTDGIKAGTPQMGQLHWEKFGGSDEGSAKNLGEFSDQLIGYALTLFGIAAVVAGLTVTILMIVGFRGRSHVAKLALESSIWIWVGCLIVGSFSFIGATIVFAAIPG